MTYAEDAAPALAMARVIRKAVTERDYAIRLATERYDLSVTELERYRNTANFLKATRLADERYFELVREATDAYAEAEG